LNFENQANPDFNKQAKIHEILSRAREYAKMTVATEKRAEQLVKIGKMKPLDALHVANAETLGAYALITCDDQLIKAAGKSEAKLKITIVSPSEFVRKESN
jgi:predicted nucleic acid-binding protein